MRARRPRVFTVIQDLRKRTFAVNLPKNIVEAIGNCTLKVEEDSSKVADKNIKSQKYHSAIHSNGCNNVKKNSDCGLRNKNVTIDIDINSNNTEFTSTNACSIDDKILENVNLALMVLHEFNSYFKSKLKSDTVSKIKDVEEINVYNLPCKSFYPRLFLNAPLDFGSSKSFIYNVKIKGKTGSLIFYSSNFKYAVKVVRESELKCVLQHMENFCKYYSLFPDTFVSKIAGIYSTPKFSFVVMDNVFRGIAGQIFDLKGKNLNRKCIGIGIEDQWVDKKLVVEDRKCITNAIRRDVEFLKSLNLMDYSLVISIGSCCNSEFMLYDEDGRVLESLKVHDQAKLEGQRMSFSVGIVDVLTEYTISKRIESILQIFCCIGSKSSKNPEEYARRFLDFIENECFEEKSN
ncbi:uncharacterized protein VICG_00394 [Vittaforma corneae ATCC 50505]|uniref:PIPK domain-containing protein n=1 Tax=Vittaforma corneae (strain ATCC 50505) TaxID=993615 RepID=L2GQQ5_VITCO|nr:uncharacterized protein VICG_00394 [Vittaforma corneae ATCC 50505]ELA42642.1 hypothetical protein VICG_00394 [Vittaforma corneae ATCC 50505]